MVVDPFPRGIVRTDEKPMHVTKRTVALGFGGVALLTLAFGIGVLFLNRTEPVDGRLEGERLALERLGDARYLYYTPASHGDLAASRPELVAVAADERAFARAAQDPGLFRGLDHARQFDALLLAGDPTTYKPLLEHLAEERDFVLAWLDNAALVFRRPGAAPWTEAQLTEEAGRFAGENRARFLSGAARRLVAIGQLGMAKRALDGAAGEGGRLPEYWTVLGLYDGQVQHWPEALEALDRALKLEPGYTPALTTKAEILFGARRLDEALAISDEVIEAHPDDPGMLLMHATISHQAHAYQREIAALQHLIELAQGQGASTTGYRIYLGQAYAESGQAMPSLVQFQEALRAGDASPEQRRFAQDCIDKIRAKTGPGAEGGGGGP